MKNSRNSSLPSRSAIWLLRIYQWTISPNHGILRFRSTTRGCKFYPSCSAYAIEAIRQYGLLRGSVVSMKRILRCNPWSHGGYDPIKISNK